MPPSSSTAERLPAPFAACREGVRVRVRVTPKASRDEIRGLCHDADGSAALKVTLTAPPADGKANAALIGLLARHWRLPKSSLAITSGRSDRRKTVTITGDPAELCRRLAPSHAELDPAGGGQ